MSMSSRDRNLAPPGRSPDETAGLMDEAPLPGPPAGVDTPPAAPTPIEPADPLLSEPLGALVPNEPLGALVPNDPVSEEVPSSGASESPHDPSPTGVQPSQPATAANAPEVPRVPNLEPPIRQ